MPDLPPAPAPQKPGLHTTEFWLSALVIAAALTLAIIGRIEGNAALAAITATSTAYTAARAWTKSP